MDSFASHALMQAMYTLFGCMQTIGEAWEKPAVLHLIFQKVFIPRVSGDHYILSFISALLVKSSNVHQEKFKIAPFKKHLTCPEEYLCIK